MKKYIALLAIAVSVAACKKETVEEEPAFEGGITITTPTATDTVHGASVIVTGAVNGNMTMHGYHVVLYKQSDNSVISDYEVDEHATSIPIQDTIVHGLVATTAVRLYIESAYDHEGDYTTKSVNFVVEP